MCEDVCELFFRISFLMQIAQIITNGLWIITAILRLFSSWEKYFAIQHFLNLHLSHSKFKFMKKLYNFSAIQMQKADELKYEKHVNYFSRHLNDSFNNFSPIQLKRNFCLMNCYDFCWIDSHYFLPLFVYCLIINYYY